MQIVLIRHSVPEMRKDKPKSLWQLSKEGIKLARKLGDLSEVKDLDIIYTSGYTKALQTAIEVSRNNYIPVHINESFDEVAVFAEKFFIGEEWERVRKDFFSGKGNAEEALYQALERFEDGIREGMKYHEKVGVVSHGALCAAFTSKYTNTDAMEIHSNIGLPDISVFDYDKKAFIKLWKFYESI